MSSTGDLKKNKTALRHAPTEYKFALLLLKTYSLFIVKLFTLRNDHHAGIIKIRRTLMGMQRIKHKLPVSYYGNVMWAVLDDSRKHVNKKAMPLLPRVQDTWLIQWPTSDLMRFADGISGRADLNLITYPVQFKMASGSNGNRIGSIGIIFNGGHNG